MSPRWPSFSMSSCRMICMVVLFAPVTDSTGPAEAGRYIRRPRKSAAATVAFAAMSVLRLTIASCLLLKSGGKTAALQNMGRSCDRGASLKAAATFWALRWPAAVLPAVLRLVLRLVLRAREIAVRLPARAHLRCLRVLLGAGRACLR